MPDEKIEGVKGLSLTADGTGAVFDVPADDVNAFLEGMMMVFHFKLFSVVLLILRLKWLIAFSNFIGNFCPKIHHLCVSSACGVPSVFGYNSCMKQIQVLKTKMSTVARNICTES